jgi:hypothetical protein
VDFAASTVAFAASAAASCVELRTPSPSSIVASLRKTLSRKRHIQIRTGSTPACKKTCAGFDVCGWRRVASKLERSEPDRLAVVPQRILKRRTRTVDYAVLARGEGQGDRCRGGPGLWVRVRLAQQHRQT